MSSVVWNDYVSSCGIPLMPVGSVVGFGVVTATTRVVTGGM